ncbi:MAG: NADH-quinone oxidoreductase subunit NuoH [Candidatus Dadabacteria bacterium]|jgi:NADH-quinone oxidoreductase subunit H|nr:NADH-quinone oxidoreductase subunit NuoH [Candidatus Dadabacteria bacterium]|tara:strand:- start:537 stop:1514 length:978 start_codon:yes stop_codon:yes gene_type:complete
MMEQFILFATPIFKTISILILIVAYLVWLERKVAAKMQSRIGPYLVGKPHGWLQPLADALKLMLKDDSKPKNSDSLLFNFGPIWIMVVSLASFALLPFYFNNQMINTDLSLMLFIAISSLVIVGIFVAGWSSNNKFALISVLRMVAQIISYEIPLVISLLVPCILIGSLNFQEIINYQDGSWIVFYPVIGQISFILFFISALAEGNRVPFDLSEAESELVSGYTTEYSGIKFALFYLAEYVHLFGISVLASIVFFGGPNGPIFNSNILIVIKSLIFFTIILFVRWSFFRIRIDQLLKLNWNKLIPVSFLVLLITCLIKFYLDVEL